MWVAASGVHRMGRKSRWQTKALVSLGAATAAGGLAGLFTGGLGSAVPPGFRAWVGVAAGIALAILSLARAPVPQRDRETPQSLLHGGPLFWATTNGALLGLAVTSRIGFWLWYVVPLTAFLSASPVTGAIVWGLYGLARLLVLDLVAMNIAFSEDAGYSITRRILESGGRARASLVAVAVVTGAATALLMGR